MVQTYDFDTNYDLIPTYAKTPDSNPAIGRIEEIDQFYQVLVAMALWWVPPLGR